LRGKASRGRSATAARGGGRWRRGGAVEAEAGGGGPMGLSRAWNWKPSNSGPERLPAVKLSRAALTTHQSALLLHVHIAICVHNM
jgi:hypothetical protein